MALQCGIIGLPNVGKSTIFNALTSSSIPNENYPFCTIDPNLGKVNIPDERLVKIAKIFQPDRIVPANVEFVDIAGLVKGASKGEGLGNRFLSHIRNVSAIIHVVRCFEDVNVSHVEDTIDPVRDAEIIETELLLKDIETVEKRIAKIRKTARIGDKTSQIELDQLENVLPRLNSGEMVKNIPLSEGPEDYLQNLSLLTGKPVLYVANVDENEIQADMKCQDFTALSRYAEVRENSAIRLCGNLEMEIAMMDAEDRKIFLAEYHLPESGKRKLIHSAFKLLDLETFFTGNQNEVHAWTIKRGDTAYSAAGEIHSDFQRGFIKAEVYTYDDLIKYGSEHNLREAGKIRLEGKDHVINDGDIVFFKFNV